MGDLAALGRCCIFHDGRTSIIADAHAAEILIEVHDVQEGAKERQTLWLILDEGEAGVQTNDAFGYRAGKLAIVVVVAKILVMTNK